MSSYNKPAAVHKVEVPFLWLKVFSAGLAAVLVGGLILGLCLRWYIRSSVQEGMEKAKPHIDGIGRSLENIRKDTDDFDKLMKKSDTKMKKMMKEAAENASK